MHKSEKVRVKAMQVVEAVWVEFVFEMLHGQALGLGNQSGESHVEVANETDQSRDGMLTMLNDIMLELFDKVKDVYCVVSSLKTQETVLTRILSNQTTVASIVSAEFVNQLMTSNSSPHLHVP